MNSKFLRTNFFVIVIAIITAVIGVCFLSKIGYQNFIYLPLKETSSGFEIIGSAVLITLFLERALEVIMNLWREPGKVEFKVQQKQILNKIEKLDNQISIIQSEIDDSVDLKFIEDQKELIELKESDKKASEPELSKINLKLDDYKAISQQYAHIISFSIGLFISLAGFGVLNEVFDFEALETKTLEINENGENVLAAIVDFQKSDSLLSLMPLVDTLIYTEAGNQKIIVNPVQQIRKNQKELKALLDNEGVVQSFKQASSSKEQQSLFMILNLLITALLLSGGTEGMHKLASVYLSFLSKTKNEFELPNENKK